jgi:hypothetical protein
LLFLSFSALAADEVPSQFQAWGSRGPGLPPLPAGWTEARGETRVRTPPEPTKEEAARGFILFQRPAFEPIYHDTVPAAFERGAKLRAFATQGQYVPLTFAMHALAPLKSVKVTAGALKTKDGEAIPASHIDVRLVMPVRSAVSYGNANDKRFTLSPFYLEKHESFEVVQGKTAQVWLSVKVPDTAKAGDYEGAITVEVDGKRACDVPVTLKVLPLKLPPTPVETSVSYFPSEDLGMREKEMIDQREHGINANESAAGAHVVSRDRHFGDDDVAATRKNIATQIGLRKKVFGEAANRFPITSEVGHQVLFEWNQKKNWFEFWPHSAELETDFFKAISVCEESLKAAGAPAMRIFITDEPGGHPDTLKESVYYYRLLKEKFPQMPTFVTLGGGVACGIDEIGLLGPYIDVITINRFDADICKSLLDRKKMYGIYNGGGATEAVTGYTRDRHFFGFYCWKSGAGEILQWVYRFGDAWKDPIRGNHGYVMLAPDGPLPSIPWEGVRAGIDDYRIMDLLWRMITAAKADPNAADAVASAKKAAIEVLSEISFNYQPRTGNGTPPPLCTTLDKWRWQVAAACVDLLKFVPLEKALATTAQRPGPLELPCPKDPGATAKYGPELLPETGFENGAGPWKTSGKAVSKGGIDSSVAHSGKASYMLENSKDATGVDVVVCVWGWGGPGPSMMLSAGKTYEFSAFVKSETAKPQIRFTVPAGSTVRENEGDEPADAGGWQRLWRRVTVNKDVKPGYLALWLQGPGKIWADDLSFRELTLPPFVVEPLQTLIDGSDSNVTVRIKQYGATEISVKVQPPGKNQPQTIKIPPQSEALVDFDPRELAIGVHELKVDLDGGAGYSASVTFKRIAGPFEQR